jgi:tRNA(Met) cytidine acetyltransferase
MMKVVTGHRDRPLVLTADRGRGKSSALAIAASQLLLQTQQPLKIIISAASRQSLNVFFSQVAKSLPSAKISANQVSYQESEITFLPIDYILRHKPMAGALFVDEAASIPVYLLTKLLKNYHRLIFASTVHGYEGAGRGFTIKFNAILEKLTPHWRKLHIEQPIRWAEHDPLEKFIFDSCLLNADLEKVTDINRELFFNNVKVKGEQPYSKKTHRELGNAWHPKNLAVRKVAAIELVNNEGLLRNVFSVLVTAHYQTTPNDVKLLLDNPSVSVITLSANNQIIGVAMLMAEGKIDDGFIEKIKQNQRRLRDQFLPQSLLTHCGIDNSFSYRYQRVMRIAIHPSLQSRGLGAFFMTQISTLVAKQGDDFLGSSFGGNQSLLKFWQQAGFSVARIGFTRDKASGEHSCLVLKPLTSKASSINDVIEKQFYQSFDYLLADQLSGLAAEFVWQVLHQNQQINRQPLAENLQQAIVDFASEARLFSSCAYGLHQWLLKQCLQRYDPDVLVLISRIFQKKAVDDVCEKYKLTGKKALNQHLVNFVAKHS